LTQALALTVAVVTAALIFGLSSAVSNTTSPSDRRSRKTTTMTDEITQTEKKQIVRDTYLSRAQTETDLGTQGRFRKETATRITAVPTYPTQPASSPWSSDPVAPEPPLGFSVDELPNLGGSMAPDDAVMSSSVGSDPTSLSSSAVVAASNSEEEGSFSSGQIK
jgi:hypothetical protein